MRVAFLGGGEVAVRTAEMLISRNHEVIIIEKDRDAIDRLSAKLDCGFLEGDGTSPAILKEVSPEQTDLLFCLSDSDQVNLVASLAGRYLGFKRIITCIRDPEFEALCRQLGLEQIIMPYRTIAQYLVDLVRGVDSFALSQAIKADARLFTFTAGPGQTGPLAGLDLPERSRVICFYRKDQFHLAEGDSDLKEGDEVVILTDSEHLEGLRARLLAPDDPSPEASPPGD